MIIGSTPSSRDAGVETGHDADAPNPAPRPMTTEAGDQQALEDERDFLLRSLRDLDAEWEAGDLDDADYRSLRDDYTARTARVLRALEGTAAMAATSPSAVGPRREGLPPEGLPSEGFSSKRLSSGRGPGLATRWSPLRLALVSGLLVAVVAGAVIGVVASSGQRGPNQSITGLTPPGGDPRLDQARARIAKKDVLGAIKLYDAVLAGDPQQPEALTYRGWLLRLTSLQDPTLSDLGAQGLRSIEAAEKADPNYPDAHVFRGIILLQDRHDPAGAVTEFRTFLSLDPANPLVPTVEEALRQALAQAGPNAPPAVNPSGTNTSPGTSVP